MITLCEKIFKLRQHGTNVRIEFLAAATVFMTMVYILAVNPIILGYTGMPYGPVFTATALGAIAGCFLLGFISNMPMAMATGMGANSFFAFTICGGVSNGEYSWQFALTATFIEGVIFIIMTFFRIRELVVETIPHSIKLAISTGIGMFIAFIGLKNAKIIVAHKATFVTMNHSLTSSPEVLVATFGIILAVILYHFKFRPAIITSIFAATILGLFIGVEGHSKISNLTLGNIISFPDSIKPIALQFEWGSIFTMKMLVCVLSLLLMEIFDTIGTLVSIARKAGLIDEKGNPLRVTRLLFADAVATTFGACVGTATVTTYVESTTGVAAGGRTGMVPVLIGIFFIIAIFFKNIFLIVPGAATTPALVLVGVFMYNNLDLGKLDMAEGIACFLTIVLMPLTYSIAEGIFYGILAYTILKILIGKFSDVNIVLIILSIILIVKVACLGY